MEKYINYVLESIIHDVEYFAIIFNDFNYCTWIVIWFLWLLWIIIKNFLLLLPFTILLNQLKFNFKKLINEKG